MIKTFTCFYLVVCPVMSLAALNYQTPVDEIRTLVEAPLAPQERSPEAFRLRFESNVSVTDPLSARIWTARWEATSQVHH